jgi:hypothetical protein
LKRGYNIDIETYSACGGALKVLACNKDAGVIEKILIHLQEKLTSAPAGLRLAWCPG